MFKYIPFTGETERFLLSARDKNISAFKLGFGARTVLTAKLASEKSGATVYVCADIFAAKKAFNQLRYLSTKAVFLPPKDDVLSYRDNESTQNYAERLEALFRITQNPDSLVVTTIEALCQLFPSKKQFISNVICIKQDKSYVVADIANRLVASGYKRVELTETEGQFSLRGDILDVYCLGFDRGIRIEFFGDEVESIKAFDPATLKSGEPMQRVTIPPATEIFYQESHSDTLLKHIKLQLKQPKEEMYAEGYHRLLSKLGQDITTFSRDMRLNFIMPLLEHATFDEFLEPSLLLFDDAKQVSDTLQNLYQEHANRYKLGLERGEVLTDSLYQLLKQEDVIEAINAPKTAFHAHDSQNRLFTPTQLFNFKSFMFPAYRRNFDALFDDVQAWMSNDYGVKIFAGNALTAENITDYFSRTSLITGGKGKLEIVADTLPESAAFFEEKIIWVGTDSVTFGGNKTVVKKRKRDAFTEPKVGSYVVHRYHGIGFCDSFTTLTVGGASRDYVLIKYAGGDNLYVPVENMDSLSHYDDAAGAPKLQKLGGAEFARIKERVRNSIASMAVDLTQLYAERASAKGHTYSENNELLDAFCAEFIHNETQDQLTATDECIQDLMQGKVMDRLLCGDVGYGKTEVALRAAFKVLCEGKQVAFLSPTTILAKQHYSTLTKRMQNFGVKAASLTRFDSAVDTAATLTGLQNGKVDMVSGTHRLLSKDVKFKDLGLLVLDEEQRFGVSDKEKIKALKASVNVLTLSATPIPRTLHLSLSGIRDISVLDTPPQERLPVKTYVTEFSESLLYDACTREIARGGQVFIVYNRVESMPAFVHTVKNILPENVRVVAAHGQMGATQLEDTIAAFAEGKFDVLVASTIIENGIDMPNANTMLVMDSDRFGLAQLYQLRGRVGRSNRLAYAYFTYDEKKSLTENAYKRLDAITQFTEFGSGFKIAMRDLEIRGAGNVLGREQHGHIERVGYDMYCKILAETVEAAKTGAMVKDAEDVKILTDFNAFLPDSYILEGEARTRVYARVSQVQSVADRKELTAELSEIYGPVPAPLDNLILVALIKNACAKLGAATATIKKQNCFIKFNKVADIPKSAMQAVGAKVDLTDAKLIFGSNREDMLKFLLH